MHTILSSSHPSRDPFACFLCLTSKAKGGGAYLKFLLDKGGLNKKGDLIERVGLSKVFA